MAKNVATVEDFEKIKNVDTGLVAMRFLVPTITEFVDDVRGAEPYTALRWYNDGIAEPTKKLSASGELDAPKTDLASTGNAQLGDLTIADGWKDAHYLQRIALAKRITGKAAMTRDEADAAIQAEVDRRAASSAGPNAVTTDKTITT